MAFFPILEIIENFRHSGEKIGYLIDNMKLLLFYSIRYIIMRIKSMYRYLRKLLKSTLIFWYRVCSIEVMKGIEKTRFYSLCKNRMWSKCRNWFCTFFFRISAGLDESTSWPDMIIDDEDIMSIEIPTFEVHLDFIWSFSNLCTGNDFKITKKSRKCFFGTRIRKEDNWLLFPSLNLIL